MAVKDFVIGVVFALVSTFGFSFLFQVDLKRIPLAVLGGGVEWATYLIVTQLGGDTFVATLIASVIATFYSETCAHICRTPATVFLMPSLIPLVPGGSLYYTMSNLLSGDYSEAWVYGRATIYVVLGIAGGVVAASLLVYAMRSTGIARRR
mgnify:FL=1